MRVRSANGGAQGSRPLADRARSACQRPLALTGCGCTAARALLPLLDRCGTVRPDPTRCRSPDHPDGTRAARERGTRARRGRGSGAHPHGVQHRVGQRHQRLSRRARPRTGRPRPRGQPDPRRPGAHRRAHRCRRPLRHRAGRRQDPLRRLRVGLRAHRGAPRRGSDDRLSPRPRDGQPRRSDRRRHRWCHRPHLPRHQGRAAGGGQHLAGAREQHRRQHDRGRRSDGRDGPGGHLSVARGDDRPRAAPAGRLPGLQGRRPHPALQAALRRLG